MPLIKTQDNGESLVVFVWQDPQGNEKTSSTASVVLAVNSLTDHHSWEPECLNRVVGTDVWFGQLTVNSKWRGSYSFIPLPANQLPGFVKKQGDGTREAQRAWWLEVVANQIPDVLNKSPILTSGWGERLSTSFTSCTRGRRLERVGSGSFASIVGGSNTIYSLALIHTK
ncbi:enterochelin esterase domain-containing protein [Marinomonas sp. GJ51-6]|uniref:enterochelin esterase domain-containing protein n=1 Tax=Marinomonas sp. GJ51-6 TaxID=2992802 RepID=UPI002934C212|nr:enterochelin esterase domain-containing protein [Marinomonas sp. GJ51-6]WOD09328.1 DUF3327 domain-containing protein [Marinomonas sp. GJ51-6]